MVTFGRGSDDDSSTSDPGGGTDPAPSTGGSSSGGGGGGGGGGSTDEPETVSGSTTVGETIEGPGGAAPPAQGVEVETPDGEGYTPEERAVSETAQDLEQQAIENNPDLGLDSDDVRVTRDGDQLQAELTGPAEADLRTEVEQEASRVASARQRRALEDVATQFNQQRETRDALDVTLPTEEFNLGSIGGGTADAPETDIDDPTPGVDLDGLAGGQDPSAAPGADPSPAPTTPGGLGDAGEFEVAQEILNADANDDIVDRATTGGLLSERGESAGLLPDEVSANTPRGEVSVDVSETRAREFSRDAAAFGDDLDIGAVTSAQAAVVEPFLGGQGVSPSAEGVDPTTDPDSERAPEEFIEGGVQTATNLPAGALQTETAAETAQAAPGITQDFETETIAETGAAVGRDAAVETATQAQNNPAEFAGAITTSAALGAGAFSRGSTGGLGTAVRAEVDPRIGTFGTTVETRAGRGIREFLADDRGQSVPADLLPDRDRDGGGSDPVTIGGDDDSGVDLADDEAIAELDDARSQRFAQITFEAERRAAEARRENDLEDVARDTEGAGVTPQENVRSVTPQENVRTVNRDREPLGAGLGTGRSRGGFDVDLSPRERQLAAQATRPEQDLRDVADLPATDTPGGPVGVGGPTTGATVGGLFGAADDETATGAGVGGLLGAPGDTDAAGATPGVEADTLGGVDLDTGFPGIDTDTDPGIDVDVGAPVDTGTDTPTDVTTDTDTTPEFDTPEFDIGTDTDTGDPGDTDTRDPGDTDTRDPRDPRDPTDPSAPQDPTDPEMPFDEDTDTDDRTALFGLRAEGRTFGSGFLSGEAAFENLLDR